MFPQNYTLAGPRYPYFSDSYDAQVSPPFPRPFNTGLGSLLDGSLISTPTVFPPDQEYPPDERVARYIPLYINDWYYRIHINPLFFNLGNLAGDQQRTLKLWNAFFDPVNVSVEELINGEGITYTSDFPLPGMLAPLRQVVYNISIDSDGPPVVDAQLHWVIDGLNYYANFSGRRAVFFGIQPNWATPYREVLEWRTTISRSYSGLEQRSATRRAPRAAYEYQMRSFKNDAKLFDLLTFGWQARMFAVPMWNEKTSLQIATTVGGNTLTLVDVNNRTFMPEQTVVIWKDAETYELAQIQSMAGNVLTLAGPLAAAWPVGTRVYPCSTSKLSEELSTTRSLPTHVDALLRFMASPTDSKVRVPQAAAPLTYRGEELYVGETNWREPLQLRIAASERVADKLTGPFRLHREADFPFIDRGFLFFAKDRNSSERIREFFVRREGRLTPVWMPSGTQDLILSDTTFASDSFIFVQKTQYDSLINENPARRDLIIRLRDGTIIARRITDVVQDNEVRSLVNLDAPLGTAFSPSQVKVISFLGLYRLASDSITFVWHNDAVVEVTTAFTLTEPT